MHIKSYFAATIEAAIEQAGRELGPDALIINSREAPPEARHAGAYEVVFALNTGDDANPANSRKHAAPAARSAPSSLEDFSGELTELREQMRELRASIRSEAAPAGRSQKACEIQTLLTDRGITPDLAEEIVKSLRARCGSSVPEVGGGRSRLTPISKAVPEDSAMLWEFLSAEMEERLSVDAEFPLDRPEAHAVALVGPPGAGKTTTLVKLALSCGLRSCRSIQFLSVDNLRIAATAQLRSYAAILGVGFEALETGHSLNQALEDHRNRGLLLIDTAGYSRAGLADACDVTRYLAGNPRIDTHLVLPASMKYADLERSVESFAIFKPSRIIFTRLDETESFGSIYSIAARSGLPVSFLTNGQSVPEDIEAATKSRMIDLILPDRARRAESVA